MIREKKDALYCTRTPDEHEDDRPQVRHRHSAQRTRRKWAQMCFVRLLGVASLSPCSEERCLRFALFLATDWLTIFSIVVRVLLNRCVAKLVVLPLNAHRKRNSISVEILQGNRKVMLESTQCKVLMRQMASYIDFAWYPL